MRGHQLGRHGLEAFPEAVSIFYDLYDMKYVNPPKNECQPLGSTPLYNII